MSTIGSSWGRCSRSRSGRIAAVARVIDTHRVRAKRAMATTRAGERLTLRTVTELRAVWDALWTALEGVLPKRRAELRGVREQV